jgi:glycosyltransferase involved in cell wall biosynthesis
LIRLDPRFSNHHVLEAIRLVIYGLRACIKFKCSVIYVPGGFPDGSIRVILPPFVVSLLCRKPLVIVIHHVEGRKNNNARASLSRIIRFLALQRVRACITVSQAAKKDIEKNFSVKNVLVSGNGVDLNTFRSVKGLAKLYDAIYFGRISREKGIFTLLETWKIVIKKFQSAKLLLLGGMEEHFVDTYRKTVDKLGLDRNITLAGFVSDKQAVKMLNSSKIFVLPSTTEGFGLAVLEAMSAGLPCILSDLPALRENFLSAAVFVCPEDAHGLARAILGLLSDPEKCRMLEERGKKLARQFSWESVARRELSIFKECTSPHQRTR